MLLSRGLSPSSYLVSELRLLQQTLIINQLAIHAYNDRPLGQTLAERITPAVTQCNAVLQEAVVSIGGTWLNSVGIRDSWGTIWWDGWDENELTSLKKKLCLVRTPLSEMLMALNS